MVDILLLEDNIELANLLKVFLNKAGYSLFHCSRGEDALAWLTMNQARSVVLDIMLPGIDGFAVCQAIRKKQNIPILIISAKSSKEDQLMGFELGADDYIEKPVDPDILCAKLKALWLRSQTEVLDTSTIISGDICIDTRRHQVYLKDDILNVNSKEYELLLLFVQNVGKTLHKEYIFNQVWGMDSDSENQTLTVHIKWLRSKIEEDPRNPLRIQTVWGVGYRYEKV